MISYRVIKVCSWRECFRRYFNEIDLYFEGLKFDGLE